MKKPTIKVAITTPVVSQLIVTVTVFERLITLYLSILISLMQAVFWIGALRVPQRVIGDNYIHQLAGMVSWFCMRMVARRMVLWYHFAVQ